MRRPGVNLVAYVVKSAKLFINNLHGVSAPGVLVPVKSKYPLFFGSLYILRGGWRGNIQNNVGNFEDSLELGVKF